MADKKVPNLDTDNEVERIIDELGDDESLDGQVLPDDEAEPEDEPVEDESEEPAEEHDEAESLEDEEEQEEDEPPVQQSSKKPVTKEQRRIIESKRKIKDLEREVERLRQESEAAKKTSKIAEKAKAYVDEGFDEDEARRRAASDIQNDEILDRLEIAEFKAENQIVLSKYPGADVRKVIATMRASGASVDTVCKLLYRPTVAMETETERREREAVISSARKASAANPTGAKRVETSSRLSKDDAAHKARIEGFIGRKLTTEEYLKYHKR